jgi:y4mF family transcriptional regulator
MRKTNINDPKGLLASADPLAAAERRLAGSIGRAAGHNDILKDASKGAIETAASKLRGMLSDPRREGADPFQSRARDILDALGAPAAGGRSRADLRRPSPPAAPAADAGSGQPVRSVADIGNRVREARRAMGMTQQRFADLAGVGRRFLVELEHGKPSLEIARVLAVCKAAGIRLTMS